MLKRFNWGCGPDVRFGWVNSDIMALPGIDIVADIRTGLPIASDSFDYVVSIHALPEIPYRDLDRTLQELRRVLKPNGVLRLALPDMNKAIRAMQERDIDYFLIGDDEVRSLSGKCIVQLTWYGQSRCMFTVEFIDELLSRNGFRAIRECRYRESLSGLAGITELDNRPLESLFVEAIK